ncbi:MAG TPA: glutamate formiminotransferase [Acidimicrobiia bacterium]|nr:glutamate formiminotransferase [Acidimicrobiia bacterium]
MLECVVNVSEGRRHDVIDAIAGAGGASLLDVHSDPDHHRSVFTLAGPGPRDAEDAARALARAAAEGVDISAHDGVHPRFGAVDVVPFVALDGAAGIAVDAARRFAEWVADELGVAAFLYGDADPDGRSLPDVRRDAFTDRRPDHGPAEPHPRLGAVAVGARPPLVAVNCTLDTDDLALARDIAAQVRERDGGLPGVRALGFGLASRSRAQVSMNVTRLAACGVERACTAVRRLAYEGGAEVEAVELVGLLPAAELEHCSPEFLAWSGFGPDHTIEARLTR